MGTTVQQRLRITLVIFGILIAGPLAMGGWALGLQAEGNVHVVEPGALYRSAQPNGLELKSLLQEYGIGTVINLRGANAGEAWYDDEIAASNKAGVTHVDIAMSAGAEPSTETIDRLVQTLREARRPILVHCKDGADRTGLAAALYELLVETKPAHDAAKQLSFWYGHFPWLGSRTVAMDRTFEHAVAKTKLAR